MVIAVLKKAIDAHTDGAFKEAEALYTKIISEEPKHPDANHNLGVLKVGSGKVEEALPLFKIALETNPSIQQFWISYIDAFMKLERWVDAKSILKQGKGLGLSGSPVEVLEKELLERIAAHPDPLADRLNPIINQFNKGNYEETLGEIDVLLKEFPNSPALQNIAGATLTKLQKFDEAISKLKSAIEAKPDFNEAYNNLANAYFESSQYLQAQKIFEHLGNEKATAQALECMYFDGRYTEFNENLLNVSKNKPVNLRISALSAFAAHQLRQDDIYPFCKEPLAYLHFSNLSKHLSDPSEFVKELLEEMNALPSAWEPNNKSTKKGFQTENSLFDNPDGNLQILRNIIDNELVLFKKKYSNSEDLILKGWPEIHRLSGWYVKLKKKGHQTEHIHPAGWISGVVYLKTIENPQENEGAIKFGLHGYNYPILRPELPQNIYQPEFGDIILFPSSLFHSTIPLLRDLERSVIAFDLIGSQIFQAD